MPDSLDQQYGAIADAIERYIEEHFWDPAGLMYSYLDVTTGQPFAKEFIAPKKVCRRALFNPWAWWTYEDSIMMMGLYLDGLCRKYEVTGNAQCLDLARKVWRSLRNVYYASQIYGPGSFLRPYGGFEVMGQFMEPLGTDQASPLFAGLYRFMRHSDPETRTEVAKVALDTLSWYERQGFQYFYYKDFIHEWNPAFQHAASYYLPAIAWAAATTGDPKWERHLDARLAMFRDTRFTVRCSFTWGHDLPILKAMAGRSLDAAITQKMLDEAFRATLESIRTYTDPGMTRRMWPESAKPGFKPYMKPDFDPHKHHGHAYFFCVHGGRQRPGAEFTFLCGLAEMGYPGAREKAAELLALRQRVPFDFTDFVWDDYAELPEEVHLYARSVGPGLSAWWRNYWLLRGAG